MFFITHNLMSMAPFSPTSDQMWADPERGRHQVLQPRMLRWFLQEQHGNLWELQLCVPQPTANAEAGGWYQNILQWWLSEAVQRGADTSERENAKMWDQNVLLIYTKTQRSLFKKKNIYSAELQDAPTLHHVPLFTTCLGHGQLEKRWERGAALLRPLLCEILQAATDRWDGSR